MAHAIPPLQPGHRVQLLEGSRELFPAMVGAIDEARSEVRLETYIFDFTGTGADIAHALERAAQRGVVVLMVVDGVGCPALPASWQHRFDRAGVQWRVYSPPGRFGLLWPGQWRRLHRKLCLVDGRTAFCGGINILDDFHDPLQGPLEAPRFDFAVQVNGPLVADVLDTMGRLWLRMQAARSLKDARLSSAFESLLAAGVEGEDEPSPPLHDAASQSSATLVLRDNVGNRGRIERAYRRAVWDARTEIIIANAYFVPGHRMRAALLGAARRGVRVRLLVQSRYENFMQYYASRPIYGAMLHAGVEIHEYAPSFLHAKVAVIDGLWATVGSSNLDPLSLLLAREANVLVEDPVFAGDLRARLVRAIAAGRQMERAEFERRPKLQRVLEWVALIAMRLALAFQGKKYL